MQSIKFFVPHAHQPHYKLHSGNLQLTTIIECICADGTALPPGFIFPGKQFHKGWFADLLEQVWCHIPEFWLSPTLMSSGHL